MAAPNPLNNWWAQLNALNDLIPPAVPTRPVPAVTTLKGDKGDKGDRGDPGNDGIGSKGSKGDPGKGDKGDKGDAGTDGAKGDKGDSGKGDKGDKGDPGKGDKGDKGDDGTDGAKGDKGDKGDDGSKGDKGDDGTDGAKGDKGDAGTDGAKGDKGDAGTDGAKGDKGDDGIEGAKGDKGDDGTDGAKGDKGDDGTDGAKGDKGDDGTDGTKGDKGDDGTDGAKGDKGDDGSDGAKGDKGDAGSDGSKGDKGDDGTDGAKGDKGDNGTDGAKGDKGDAGTDGTKGDKGDAGTDGNKGDKGDNGAKGDKGDNGTDGAKGDKGDNGTDGAKGDKGDNGTDGAKGDKGDNGTDGAKGDKGDAGTDGAKGDKGDAGTDGTKGDKGDAGTDGTKGDKGDAGTDGTKGDKGDAGTDGTKGDKGDAGTDGTKGDKGDNGTDGAKGDKGDNGTDGAKGDKGDKGDTGSSALTVFLTGEVDYIFDPNTAVSIAPNGRITPGYSTSNLPLVSSIPNIPPLGIYNTVQLDTSSVSGGRFVTLSVNNFGQTILTVGRSTALNLPVEYGAPFMITRRPLRGLVAKISHQAVAVITGSLSGSDYTQGVRVYTIGGLTVTSESAEIVGALTATTSNTANYNRLTFAGAAGNTFIAGFYTGPGNSVTLQRYPVTGGVTLGPATSSQVMFSTPNFPYSDLLPLGNDIFTLIGRDSFFGGSATSFLFDTVSFIPGGNTPFLSLGASGNGTPPQPVLCTVGDYAGPPSYTFIAGTGPNTYGTFYTDPTTLSISQLVDSLIPGASATGSTPIIGSYDGLEIVIGYFNPETPDGTGLNLVLGTLTPSSPYNIASIGSAMLFRPEPYGPAVDRSNTLFFLAPTQVVFVSNDRSGNGSTPATRNTFVPLAPNIPLGTIQPYYPISQKGPYIVGISQNPVPVIGNGVALIPVLLGGLHTMIGSTLSPGKVYSASTNGVLTLGYDPDQVTNFLAISTTQLLVMR